MKELRLIIIDDEKRVRMSLSGIIQLHCPNVSIVGEAENADKGIEIIRQYKPDVVLLDIKMPGGTGFDLLKKLMPINFKVIFVTAYDEYAVKAIKFGAIDYLLKPVIPDDLVEAINKARHLLNFESENQKINTFMGNMNSNSLDEKKIVLNTHEATHVIYVSEIIRCEADRNYTRFYLLDKRMILVSGGLKEYDDMLNAFGFIRSHHSHLVNLSHIVRLEKRNGGVLIMKDGSEVPVSIRKYHEVYSALNKL